MQVYEHLTITEADWIFICCNYTEMKWRRNWAHSNWGCVRTCRALLTRQFPRWNITAELSNCSQHGCTPINEDILGSHRVAAEMCRLDFPHWPRTSPQHPTVFNILLRKRYLLLYDAFRNNLLCQYTRISEMPSAAGTLLLLGVYVYSEDTLSKFHSWQKLYCMAGVFFGAL